MINPAQCNIAKAIAMAHKTRRNLDFFINREYYNDIATQRVGDVNSRRTNGDAVRITTAERYRTIA
ncbi:hypothetical protein TMES_17690 [Thalassospira mesophila]|uniref:Uncharacterized protein n=1 Tax=Thalassospira mesophila TaxID=1293891 RepID=A0A1Y2KWM9_9PROT|nr:hypothetical protein TMES_17690 [Thalassospira mesophila]